MIFKMQVIADLQIHSRYSRAVSQEMVIPKIWEWAKRKGIGLVATGDWTHPLWMREIKQNLEETGNGLLKVKSQKSLAWPPGQAKVKSDEEGPYFLLATEISSIYSQGGKLRRIHNLVWAPSFATADRINKELQKRGANLISDGRPIVGLTSSQIAELVFSVESTCLVIPAHIWTPWFSLFGSESGFDSVEECFGNFSRYIYAVETGLSSDPAMNWRIKELDSRSIVSFSDAHSGPKLGREATVFELEELSYENLRKAIMTPDIGRKNGGSKIGVENSGLKMEKKILSSNCIAYTIEFYPEEGKYHYTGHRACGIKQSPQETKQKGAICPVCGRKLTIGVMNRVEQLAGRDEKELRINKQKICGTNTEGIFSESIPSRPAYVMSVPLQEILAESVGSLVTSQSVQNEYKKLTDYFAGEFKVLLATSPSEIEKISGPKVAEAITKVRNGDIAVDPGYDGVFGVVKIWPKNKDARKQDTVKEQLSLF